MAIPKKVLIDKAHVCSLMGIGINDFKQQTKKITGFPEPVKTTQGVFYDEQAIYAIAEKRLKFNNLLAARFIRGEFSITKQDEIGFN